MAKGAKALIILAMDKDAILPAVTKASRQKIPVVAYDRLIEAPGVFYITFDNVEVGRMAGARSVQGRAKGQLRVHQGLAERSERELPACRRAGGCRRGGEEGRHQDRRRRIHRRLEA
jgi:ABC-type sugar transport system substrate-binding protein